LETRVAADLLVEELAFLAPAAFGVTFFSAILFTPSLRMEGINWGEGYPGSLRMPVSTVTNDE
jgi:hypothetical protein